MLERLIGGALAIAVGLVIARVIHAWRYRGRREQGVLERYRSGGGW